MFSRQLLLKSSTQRDLTVLRALRKNSIASKNWDILHLVFIDCVCADFHTSYFLNFALSQLLNQLPPKQTTLNIRFNKTDGTLSYFLSSEIFRSTDSLRARLALMFHYRTEMDARQESVMSCLRKGEELYQIFLSQNEQEVQDKVEDTITGRCTPLIVVDSHQPGLDSTEEAALPYSFLNRPSVGQESQTASTEMDEKRITESIGRKTSSHMDSPSGYEIPSTSSTKYSEFKSYQSAVGSDEELAEEETNYPAGKLTESPEPEFSIDDKELTMLSSTLPVMPSASRSPSIQAFSSSNEVKQHMYDLITKWCELHQFWCEVYRRLKFQLWAASFAS